MIQCNLGHYPKFYTRMIVGLTANGRNSRLTPITSQECKRYLKDEFDLDVDILPGAMMWDVSMDEEQFMMFTLKWS